MEGIIAPSDFHQPVMLAEVLTGLKVSPIGIYVDATFGRGGHAKAVLDHLGPQGRLYGFDKDPQAIEFAKKNFPNEKRLHLTHGSFTCLNKTLEPEGLIGKVDGILIDLGVSLPQLVNPERGFSFLQEGPLDMRMDNSCGMTAAEWLNSASEAEIADVLWRYGEEQQSRKIARMIVNQRQQQPLHTTRQLVDLIRKTVGTRDKHKHPATRTFQAIRILINQELEDLEKVLVQAIDVLKVGGHLVVLSFHSLEDRIVKHFVKRWSQPLRLPKELPVKGDAGLIRLRSVGRAIKPTREEIAANPRSRSATLRIVEKIA